MYAQHPMRRFTLIEMLVVTAILMVIASILLPALGKAKEKSRSIACMNNQKQLGLALAMYTTDYDDYLCPVRSEDYSMTWMLYLWQTQFSGDPARRYNDILDRRPNPIWGCPTWDGLRNESGSLKTTKSGYGMNAYGLRSQNSTTDYQTYWKPFHLGNPVKLQEVVHPSLRANIAEAPDWHVTGDDPHDYANTDSEGNPLYGFASWSKGRPNAHGTRANYLMFDARVAQTPHQKGYLHLSNPLLAQ